MEKIILKKKIGKKYFEKKKIIFSPYENECLVLLYRRLARNYQGLTANYSGIYFSKCFRKFLGSNEISSKKLRKHEEMSIFR